MRPPANYVAHVERREQRVTIYWNKISTTPPSHDRAIRTSAHREIKTDVHESVRKGGGLHGPDQKQHGPGQTVAHGNERAYGTKASQHPRLNSERDLWRAGVSRELSVRETPYEHIDHCIRA